MNGDVTRRRVKVAGPILFVLGVSTWILYRVIAQDGEPQALILLLLLLPLAIAAVEPLLLRSGPRAARPDLVAHDGAYRPGIVFPFSRGRQWLRTLGLSSAALMFALGLVLVDELSFRIAGVLVLVGVLPALVVSIWDLRRPMSSVALLRAGILTPLRWRSVLVPWGAIERTKVVPRKGGDDFVLVLRNAEREIVLPEDDLVASEEEFRESVERLIRDPAARVEIDR